MKRSCKNIDITNWEVVYPWVLECVKRHKKRYDFQRMLVRVGKLTPQERDKAIAKGGDLELLEKASRNISKEAARRIEKRELNLSPCHIREKQDHSTLKWRMIGKECAMQQIFDYIAVRSCDDIWRRRIVPQQTSSIKNRGQVYGTAMISKWLKSDAKAAKYAQKHNLPYERKCKYYVKLDITKCYQSMRCNKFMGLFRRDCGNDNILWLWETLLKSHRVPLPDGTINEGFMIGALPSQMAAQYMLSFLYRHITGLHYTKCRERHNLISHAELFMDDILITSQTYENLICAAQEATRFADTKLGLTIKQNWQVRDIDKSPIDMMGFVAHADGGITIRPRVFIKARRMALRAIRHGISLRQARRISSYKGYFWQRKKKHLALALKPWLANKKYYLLKIFKKSARIISKNERSKNENRIYFGTSNHNLHAVA